MPPSRGERLAGLRNELGWSQEGLATACGYDVRQVRRAERDEPGVSPEAVRAMIEALMRGIKDSWRAAAEAADPSVPADPGTSEEAKRIARRVRDIAGVNREALKKLEQAARMLAEAEALLREPPPPRRRPRWLVIALVAIGVVALVSVLAWLWMNRSEHRRLEGEDGSGAGRVMMRGAASREATVWLHADEVRRLDLPLSVPASCRFRVRYSNDNAGASEMVTLSFDGRPVGRFRADDTGNGGYGWNVFATSPTIATVAAGAGLHTIEIRPSGGDGYGIEIDAVDVELKK